MVNNRQPEKEFNVFQDIYLPEAESELVGYAALIKKYNLKIPLPDFICAIGIRHKKYNKGIWQIYTPRHKPKETLYGNLVFALKYEGINLSVLKALFTLIKAREITTIIENEPTGSYSRRIWFLYEWLTGIILPIEDALQGNLIDLIDNKLQYPGPTRASKRHRIRNNLPGTINFCPLIRRTEKLDKFINIDLSNKVKENIGKIHSDILHRASAFLLLKDSRASYAIEGESPPINRIERWGKVIGQAGLKPLSHIEFNRLQNIVISDKRFTKMGYRSEGGFIGNHDRISGLPIPDHISANHQDITTLINGLINTYNLLLSSNFDPVLLSAVISFGFIFIHLFEDGNGRIHRYLIHHVLSEMNFTPKGLVFPISAIMLENIDSYRKALESYSIPRLEFIEWQATENGNIEVLNDTIDLYRYFDATKQAEFLYECVHETVNNTLPQEVKYLQNYDNLSNYINNYIDLPNRLVDLLIRFLYQNNGKLSNRAKENEFQFLTKKETKQLENKFKEIFNISHTL